MPITVIEAPYDSGRFRERMGRGPAQILDEGLVSRLESDGHEVQTVSIRLPDDFFPAEVAAAVELHREISQAVREARDDDRLPIVLTGNCNYAALGVLAGLSSGSVGVLWLDAHADFNTPDTSPSGFLDGMALPMATGEAYPEALRTVPGLQPLPTRNVVLLGARDVDPAEEDRLEASDVNWLKVEAVRETGLAKALRDALEDLPETLYLHVDLDVLDVSVARANQFAAPGGLTVDELHTVVETVSRHRTVVAAALTAYDPGFDDDGRACEAGIGVLEALVGDAGDVGGTPVPRADT